MSLSSAVQWWDESQLRVLVLSSLGIQYFLAIFAGRRKESIPPWYRFLIWLLYLASDAVAIYALATLFNRQKKLQYSSEHGSRDLEVLWAPILLVHLGGPMFITAYNIEDNELWRRYIVTVLSQVTVAIYVFCKSWSSSADKRLLAAAILLFIVGIFKCFEKPWSLKSASFNRLASSSSRAERTQTTNREKELEAYVKEAKAHIQANDSTPTSGCQEQLSFPEKLFVDIAYSYSERLTNLKSFWVLEDHKAYESLKMWLSDIFDILYTRMGTGIYRNSILFSSLTWMVTMVFSILAISLIHSSHKKAYSSSDVIVTFILSYSILMLEIISLFIIIVFFKEWPNSVAQHSLIGFFARNKRHTKLMSIARCLQCDGLLDQYLCMKPCSSGHDITNLVRGYVQDGWKEYIEDAESYKKFNDTRGQWKLEREGCDGVLGWSLEKPFDESVLLWHMATHFCCHTSSQYYSKEGIEISNYMMHLLFANPEMLMASTRRNLFRTAYDEVEDMLKGEETLLDEKEVMQKITDKVKTKEGSKESFIHDAWQLAEGLIGLSDERKMWEVIQGVWVEMLCFSAGRCRGYLHAKSLGSDVEYISVVWLLLAYMGMETFPDKLQRTQRIQLSREKKYYQYGVEEAAAPSASQGMELPKTEEISGVSTSASQLATELPKEEENAAAPSASQGEGSGTVPELNEIVVSP